MSGESLLNIGICVAAAVILSLLWWKDVIRPGSLGRAGPRGGKRDPSGVHPAIWLLCAAIAYVAQMFGASLALSLPPGVLGDKESVRFSAIIALSGYAASIAAAAFLAYMLIPRVPNGGLRFRWKDLLVGAGAFLLILPIVLAVGIGATEVYTLVHGSPPDQIAHSVLQQINDNRSKPWIIGVVGMAVVGAPIQEEFIFRIFLQSALVCVFLNRWAAVVCTGVLFALIHRAGAEPVPWHAIAPIFALGVSAGVAYERTGRPGAPMTVHALFNAANVALVVFGGVG
jgi:membrane protease YdiL (CAAX protease family)